MSRLRDALGQIRHRLSRRNPGESVGDPAELAAGAASDRVSPDVIAEPGRSKESLVTYLAEGEQPEHVVFGNEVIVDNGDSHSRKYPTRETQVLVTDRRVVVVLGGQFSDDLWEMAHDDIETVYVDEEGLKDYLILDATRDDDPMTFFVDVSVEDADSAVRSAVEYLRERSK